MVVGGRGGKIGGGGRGRGGMRKKNPNRGGGRGSGGVPLSPSREGTRRIANPAGCPAKPGGFSPTGGGMEGAAAVLGTERGSTRKDDEG